MNDPHFSFSICDEPKPESSSANQEKIYSKVSQLNETLHQLLQRWAQNISQLREIGVAIIQLGKRK